MKSRKVLKIFGKCLGIYLFADIVYWAMIGTGRFLEDFKIAKEHDIRVTDLSPGAFWKVLVQKSIDDGNRSKNAWKLLFKGELF